MKIVFIFPVLLMCSGLILAQPAYAVKNPKNALRECQQRVERLEKDKRKQSTTAEKVRTLDERYSDSNQSSQTAQPRFEPYSYP